MRKFSGHSKLLAGILIVSVLARLAGAIYLGDQVEELPGTFDQISYHTLALRVLNGYGFSFGQDWWPVTPAGEPTAHWSFLYTFFLTAVYSLFGPHPLAARIIQAIVVGMLQPFLAYRIGSRLFSQTVGTLAALLAALYAYFVYYAGTLVTEPFYILAVLLVLNISIEIVHSPHIRNRFHTWLLLGLTMGVAVLLRQVFLIVVPFILLWVAWATTKQGQKIILLQFALPIIVLAGMIIPFTVYNSSRFDTTVLLNTNSGYAFFWGNHPYYGTNFQPILPDGIYTQLIPPEFKGMDEAALDKALLGRAMEFIIADPGRYLLLSVSRIPDYFMFWPSPDSRLISNVARVLSFGILWPFMLIGLILAAVKTHGSFGEKLASPTFFLALFVLLYSSIHILTWTLIRYRLPVDAVLLIFASYLLIELDQKVFHFRRRFFHVQEPSQSVLVPDR